MTSLVEAITTLIRAHQVRPKYVQVPGTTYKVKKGGAVDLVPATRIEIWWVCQKQEVRHHRVGERCLRR